MTAREATARVRWGVVGTGKITRQITSDFSLVNDATVVAVASRRHATAHAFAADFDIPGAFDDYTRMLESDIDAVYLGTPHVTHFDYARQALLSGRHVLCEKPLGMNLSEVRELARIAKEHDVFLMEAMWMKFNPLYARLTEILAEGVIGEVRSLRASFGAPFPQDGSSRWQPGGSALLDQGIYPVTLSHMLFGEPSTVAATGLVRDDGVDLAENFTLNYPGGRFTQGASSMIDFLDMSATIAGTSGWITIDGGFWYADKMTIHGFDLEGKRAQDVDVVREGFGYTPMLRDVTIAIRRGERESRIHPLEHTIQVFDTLDRIRAMI